MDTLPLCRPLMLAGFLFLLLVPGHTSDDKDVMKCYKGILNDMNLTKDNVLLTKFRPGGLKECTKLYIYVTVFGILNVNEKEQTFLPYIWIYMSWTNPNVFLEECKGLERLVVPADLLWKPDLTIEEMIKKEERPKPDHLTITNHNSVEYRESVAVLCTCKIHVYKFPFDKQTCKLSFKSAVYNSEEIQFRDPTEEKQTPEYKKLKERVEKLRLPEDEWKILDVTSNITSVVGIKGNQSVIIYTITMKRQSFLYFSVFLVPILFIFFLDIASFLMSDSEKLSYQVTLLLSVTVMQLLLNDILPSYSHKIPLIVVFCIGIFGLMMCNLLKTILMMYLIEKDNQAGKDKGQKEEENPGCWARMTKMINKFFFIVYISVSLLFFVVLFSLWRRDNDY